MVGGKQVECIVDSAAQWKMLFYIMMVFLLGTPYIAIV